MGEVAFELLRLLNRSALCPVEHDPEYPSPCEQMPPDHHGMVEWWPVPMKSLAAFDGVTLHPSISEFYGSFWGGHAGGRHSGEAVNIHIAWNADELARITRQVVAQVATGDPVMVAYTDSDWYFAVNNMTGAVWLCEPGHPPMRQVAPSLAAFLAGVE